MVWHLWKLNLLNPDIVKKSFTTYTREKADNGEGKIDYDIMRYRRLSVNDVKKELENE